MSTHAQHAGCSTTRADAQHARDRAAGANVRHAAHGGMRRRMLALVAFCLLAFALPAAAQAQGLARVETLLLRGRFTDARSALTLWQEQNPRAAPADMAHALLLTGQLATDAAAATDAYLALVLTYPTSAHAPVALLRLGQGLLAGDEPERARGYLERLVRDYPNVPDRAEALLWLARAQHATGRTELACANVRDARTLRTSAETAALLADEESRACATR